MSGDLTFREYVEVFGDDLIPVLDEKIPPLNKDIERLVELREAKIEALQRLFVRKDLLGRDFSKWFVREWLKIDKLLKLEVSINRKKKELRNILTAYNYATSKEDELNVDLAKQTPIETFYIGKLRKVGQRFIGLCPFHKEKTPSFNIFTETNSYHCFGCKVGGDVIDFLMKTDNLTFIEAVKRLS